MSDPHDLQRFLDAQEPVLADVRAELRRGQKDSHWMWFVFPQLRGLGASATARRYAIASREEALAYLAHPLLGARLRECTQLALAHAGLGASELFGYPDDLKFRSCMTLFAAVAPGEQIFAEALQRFFAGAPDDATLARL
jgi:uncharacterized protein (DUF1810 family)